MKLLEHTQNEKHVKLFLTHTVQMKLFAVAVQCLFFLNFLTHTVQMKLLCRTHNLPFLLLLNPHGSDETRMMTKEKRRELFFLTHTVQMKLLW